MFRNEIHKVGTEGAKVLRELENKLEKLEKLSPGFDLLEKVHEAAEELQMLIDEKSYHFSDHWAGARRQKEFEDHDQLHALKDEETMDSPHHLKRCHTLNHHVTNVSMNPFLF